MVKSRKPSPPKREEWDFSKVPEAELQTCFIYEFAREFVKTSDDWQTFVRREEGLIAKHRFFLDIFGENWRAPLSAFNQDFLTTPWQCLPPETKREEQEWVCWRRDHMNSAKALFITLSSEFRSPEWTSEGIHDFQTWSVVDRAICPEAERGFISVNFTLNDKDLLKAFADWLHSQRVKGKKATRSQRGKNKPRDYLKALGAKRLLAAGLRVYNASVHSEKICDSPLYDAPRTWSMAKYKVAHVIRNLFDPARVF